MQTDRSARYWPYVAGVLLLAAIVWAVFFRHADEVPVQTMTPVAKVIPRPDAVGNAEAEPATPPLKAISPSSRPAAVNYEHSDNLQAVIRATEGKSDAASLGLRARALQECEPLAASPDHFAKIDTDGPARYGENFPIVKRQVETYLKRCGDLAQVMEAGSMDVKAAIEEAAKAGNLWAKAVTFPRSSQARPSSEVDGQLKSFLASRDPDAIDALAADMTRQRTDSNFSDLAGSPLSTYAWQLVSCELGRDCSASGQLMREACIFGGKCGTAADFHALLKDSVLTADELSRVESVEQAILDAIRTRIH